MNKFIKYGTTFYVGMDQVQNGHLYGEQLCDNHSKVRQNKTLRDKKPVLNSIVKKSPKYFTTP